MNGAIALHSFQWMAQNFTLPSRVITNIDNISSYKDLVLEILSTVMDTRQAYSIRMNFDYLRYLDFEES